MKRLIVLILVFGLSVATVGTEPPAEESSESEQEALEEFIPSEEVSADSAVAFPVDI